MKKLRAIWGIERVLLTCAWCLASMEALDIGEVKALGPANIRCGHCGQINTIPGDLLGHAANARAKSDPDNPPGRATAWDGIVGNIVLKRALEVAITGHHTLTYVGHPENGWKYVQQVLGPLASSAQKCPCGGYLDPERDCNCTLEQIREFRGRRPFKEALEADIIVEAHTPKPEEVFHLGEPYASVLARVKRVRDVQVFERARVWADKRSLRSDNAVFNLMNMYRSRLKFTAEQLKRVQYVARTIAEMEGKGLVEITHMAEAIQYRTPLLEPQ